MIVSLLWECSYCTGRLLFETSLLFQIWIYYLSITNWTNPHLIIFAIIFKRRSYHSKNSCKSKPQPAQSFNINNSKNHTSKHPSSQPSSCDCKINQCHVFHGLRKPLITSTWIKKSPIVILFLTKVCCIYHRPGESSSDTCTSDDEGNALERDRHTKHLHKQVCSKRTKKGK